MRRWIQGWVLAVFSASCSGSKSTHIDQVVWANDGTGHAYVVVTSKNNRYKHQIFVQNTSGLQRKAITPVREHQTGAVFYYMKEAGYVVVEVIESDTRYRYDHITTDGEVRTLAVWDVSQNPCTQEIVIPSPSGSLIADVVRTDASGKECLHGKAYVRLLDGHSLKVLKTYQWSMDDSIDATWTPDNTLVVQAESEEKAWSMDLQHPPHPTMPPGCMFPKTTSSMVSKEGSIITQGYPEGAPVETVPDKDPSVSVFGCQTQPLPKAF